MDHLAGRLAAASVSSADDPAPAPDAAGRDGNLLDVIRAVERAEGTIRDQLQENNRLKEELMKKTRLLQRVSEDATSQSSFGSANQEPRASAANKMDGPKSYDGAAPANPRGASVLHPNGVSESGGDPLMHERMRHKYLDSGQANGGFRRDSAGMENGGPSQFSTPSSRSTSPTRPRKEGDYESRLNLLAGQALLPASEMNSNMSWKQDLTVKVKEHEEEIAQLRKHLDNYLVKEAQILKEKSTLEKRIAYMRVAFDHQQQDLVDAASKALAYRQDITEENIRLSYALQTAHQERSMFISSLLPILSEYDSLRPSVLDAQSIVGSLKVLFRHLQEQLMITEEKVKESQYQITPWQNELPNKTSLPVQSPNNPVGKVSSKSSLDIVPQTPYPQVQSPMSSPVQARSNWSALGKQNHQVIPSEVPARNIDQDYGGRTTLSSSRQFRKDVPAEASQRDPDAGQFDFDAQSQNLPLKGLSRRYVLDDSVGAEDQHVREPSVPSAQWGSEDSPNLESGLEEANPSYPYLPTVPEEPGSSFSEAAEDDPLPGIEGLRITGEAFPGRDIQASGYSTNGTTSCNFEWVRHLDDGSVKFIEGARQPNYLVTADDVDTLLAIEVQPLDDRKRKGDIVKVYANEQTKITCDPQTKELIKKTLEVGHVSYQVQLPQVRFLDMWEPAVLAIKREGYSIKCNGQRGVVLTEKFQQATTINIPYGNEHPTEFSIVSADGDEYNLQSADDNMSRDTIVLVLRLFKSMAVEKRRGRKKGLFFK